MDPRITERINKINKEESEKRKEEDKKRAQEREQHLKYVKSKIPAAEEFVEKYMLDEIAKLSVKRVKEMIVPSSYNPYVKSDSSEYRNVPPVEALVEVLKKIDGLYITEKYFPEHESHIYSDDVLSTVPASTEYTVHWK